MKMKFKYNPPKTGAGELRTPVLFFEQENTSPEPNESLIDEHVFKALAEVYNPSIKDLEIMNVNGVKKGITIKIRDPLTHFLPQPNQIVKIDDFRYKNVLWEVIEVRPDIQDNQFVTILLGVSS